MKFLCCLHRWGLYHIISSAPLPCVFHVFMQINERVLSVCSKLIETAKLCLNAKDKYLTSTISFLDKNLPAAAVSSSIAI